MQLLVTGGAGFIGSHFVRRMLRADDIERVTVLDALTYAGSRGNLGRAFLDPKLDFVVGDICDPGLVDDLMARHTAVVHFAAESHVDRSFTTAGTFVTTNVIGTQTLADAAMRYGIAKFVHVSTDEVYGPLLDGAATEDYPLAPNVPYAASKAASDLVALSYWHTYGAPVCVTRSSNNYGPCQHPEKIIPLFLTSLLRGELVTLHGEGQHIRNWLHVEDNCAGIELVLRAGTAGEVYNIGGGTDLSSKELTGELLRICGADWDRVTYVPDRLSNDVRYAMNWGKVAALGYRPARDLQAGLEETADWYRRNADRWAPLSRNFRPPCPPRAPHRPPRRSISMPDQSPRQILVSGVGANPGFGLARSLLKLGHRVVAVDANPLAPGFFLDDVSPYVIPRATDPAYPAAMTELCRALAVDAIVAGIENDLPPLLDLRPRLEADGVRLWLPDAKSVHDCIDKARFHHVLTEHGIPTPRTWEPQDLDLVPTGVELVVKPRGGHGAQGVHMVTSLRHARVLCELVPGAIVQERIHGTEFTADCLMDREGKASAILRKRDLVKAGCVAVSSTFKDQAVHDLVLDTLRAVRARGLCCVQGFITDDDRVTITEVNVRIAGGYALSVAAGADLVGQMVNGLFGLPVDHDQLTYRTGMFLTNCLETLHVGAICEWDIAAAPRGAVA